MSDPKHSDMPELLGQIVVLDLASPFVYLGRLMVDHPDYLVLEDVDAHDLRDTATTREKYVLDCHLHGINPNRRRLWVNRREIVSISLLADVIGD